MSTRQTRGIIFHETVVLMLKYEAGQSAEGVIINKKSLVGGLLAPLPHPIRSTVAP